MKKIKGKYPSRAADAMQRLNGISAASLSQKQHRAEVAPQRLSRALSQNQHRTEVAPQRLRSTNSQKKTSNEHSHN